ncbi:MAG: S8 family serine peptidase [Marinilabiliales bacterium]
MKIFSIIFLIICALYVEAQTQTYKYWIKFTDKTNTPYSIDSPEQFLSQRAIERRNKYNISIDSLDLPVDPEYIDSLRSYGLKVLNVSKWMNSVTVETTDSLLVDTIELLGFVSKKQKVYSANAKNATNAYLLKDNTSPVFTKTDDIKTLYDYGLGTAQIGMLNGHILHNNGFQGQGMHIAVIDAGFQNSNVNSAFDSLWADNRVLGTRDFVNPNSDIFSEHSHGNAVLSIMAAYLPGELIGTAPKASYWLLRSEDVTSESLVEEDNWISAAEFADSAGVDLINTSLGYNTFDDSTMDHKYSDLDGNTTRISRAVDIASSKGILVVVSAGNSGNQQWHYIGVPADADSCITVGSVDGFLNYSDFSSTGPTADGRVKPDVVALGSKTVHQTAYGDISVGNGTSFSAPIICGLAACLWQANPNLTNMEIIDYIRKSASQYNNPDSLLGYGIPDFAKAYFMIQGIDYDDYNTETYISAYPNPFSDKIYIDLYSVDSQYVHLFLIDMVGKIVVEKSYNLKMTSYNRINIDGLEKLNNGAYILKIQTKENTYQKQILKN